MPLFIEVVSLADKENRLWLSEVLSGSRLRIGTSLIRHPKPKVRHIRSNLMFVSYIGYDTSILIRLSGFLVNLTLVIEIKPAAVRKLRPV